MIPWLLFSNDVENFNDVWKSVKDRGVRITSLVVDCRCILRPVIRPGISFWLSGIFNGAATKNASINDRTRTDQMRETVLGILFINCLATWSPRKILDCFKSVDCRNYSITELAIDRWTTTVGLARSYVALRVHCFGILACRVFVRTCCNVSHYVSSWRVTWS